MVGKVAWDNALSVPLLGPDDTVLGVVMLVNKTGRAFDDDDLYVVNVLLGLYVMSQVRKSIEKDAQIADQARFELIRHTAAVSCIKSSDLAAIAQEAVERIMSLLKANYCAIFLDNAWQHKNKKAEDYAESCTQYDNLGRTNTTRRGDGLPGRVFNSATPVNLDNAGELEASGLPPGTFPSSKRTLVAVPMIASNDSKVQGVILVAGKLEKGHFDELDEKNLSDFALILAGTIKVAIKLKEAENLQPIVVPGAASPTSQSLRSLNEASSDVSKNSNSPSRSTRRLGSGSGLT
mmetsp:Transcript_34309/g.53517  ORF Transcript_34309/g.53517 Transcript_34309/m.53517 type:complete len:292 (-) Transcript_34309:936-1811(-)